MSRLRWKKNDRETGLIAVCAGPRGSYYHDGEKQYASVSYVDGKWHKAKGWYFVAGWDSDVPHYNSCDKPCGTEKEAKQMAKEYVNKYLEN